MNKIDFLAEEQAHSLEVRRLVKNYRDEDPNYAGDGALDRRMSICRAAYQSLCPEDFHKFMRSVVVTEAMRTAPELYVKPVVSSQESDEDVERWYASLE